MSSNRKWILSILMAAVVGWTQVGCMLPEEGTIVYDQDYPEIPTDNVGGSGSGGDSGGDREEVVPVGPEAERVTQTLSQTLASP